MKKNMKEYKEETKKLHPIPRSVQDLIPIYRVGEHGVFQIEKKPRGCEILFDKAYLMVDMNFTLKDDEEQDRFLDEYSSALRSLKVPFKIVLMNSDINLLKLQQEVCIRNKDSSYKEMIDAINRYVTDAILFGHGGMEQIKLLILTCQKKDLVQAEAFFRAAEANLALLFQRMESGLIPLSTAERLAYLGRFYRMGAYDGMDYETIRKNKIDWKDMVSPRMICYAKKSDGTIDEATLQVDTKFARAFYLEHFPSGIQTHCMQRLMSGQYRITIMQDMVYVPKEAVQKRNEELYMQIGHAIEKQQETRNKAFMVSSDISYDLRRQKVEVENLMDAINDGEETYYYAGVYALISAESKQELESAVIAFLSIAEGEGFTFHPFATEQIAALQTMIPAGGRYVTQLAPLLTRPIAAMTPFSVNEIYQVPGIVYGINQISKNIILGDRKKLINGNGFVVGVSGSGKSFIEKMELIQVHLTEQDEIVILDPTNEYKDYADYFHGSFIDLSQASTHHINPLDTDTFAYMDSKNTFIKDKTNLMLSIFSQIKENEMEPEDNSLIGRCIQIIYHDLSKKGFAVPTLKDFYEVLKRQPEERATDLALSLELFVTGAMNMFSKQTNVNMKNRLTVYGMADIDKNLSGLGTILVLEGVRASIARNAKRGIYTRLNIDEAHNLTQDRWSALYLQKIWREVRKRGGICTAMTQNVADLFATRESESMFCNSEFITLLNLKESERDLLEHKLGVSPNLLQYVSHAECGCGLLKFGNRYVPKDGRLPKDSEMYKLCNTDFDGLQEIKKRELKKEQKNLHDLINQVAYENPTELEKIYP